MTRRLDAGFSLVELTLSLGLMSMLCVALVGLVETGLRAQAAGDDRSALWAEGHLAMDRMATAVRRGTVVHFPNAHGPTRTALAVSGAVNDDDDAYFGDPELPRIDEDLWADMTLDGQPGIQGWDDDGDGLVDEPPSLTTMAAEDDDEDGLWNEDPWDGVDNDGDGNIDEDVHWDMNGDGAPGIANFDDDGDGTLDEQDLTGSFSDDDEDGQYVEEKLNPVIFVCDAADSVLHETMPQSGTTGVLCTHVKSFSATYVPPTGARGPLVSISLTLLSDAGESLTLNEVVYPRNVLQRSGRQLR